MNAKKLLVLGATGGTGLQVVDQAVERGLSVTAFVRSANALKSFGDRITVICGNLLSSSDLHTVIENHDAVLSAFGPRQPWSKEDENLLHRFATVLTGAMVQSSVRRLVIESTAFLFKDAIFPPANLVGRLFFPAVVRDAAEMERIVQESGLEWTIVRPPRLTDKPRTGQYRVGQGHLPPFGLSISRANVADFMLRTIQDPASNKRIVGVSN